MSDAFGKEMADTWRGIKDDFEHSLEPPPPADNGVSGGGSRHGLDKSIVEQMRADLDGLIEKHGRK